jgi:hypothetical protein
MLRPNERRVSSPLLPRPTLVLPLTVLAHTLAAGCGAAEAPNALDLRVSFLCDADRKAADRVRFAVREGDCTGGLVYWDLLSRGSAPQPVPTLARGRYGIAAEAYVEGELLAGTCVDVTLPTSKPIALALASEACGVEVQDIGAGIDDPDAAAPDDTDPDAVPRAPSEDAGSEPAPEDAGDEPVPAPDPCDDPDAPASCSPCGRACAASETCVEGVCAPVDASVARCVPLSRGRSEYLVCSEAMAWVFARERCAAWGFGLVIIDDADENVFLALSTAGLEPWTAANDLGPSDVGADGLDIQLTDIRIGSAPANCRLVDGTPGEGHWFWAQPGSKQSNGRSLCTLGAAPSAACAGTDGAYVGFAPGEPDNYGCSCLIGCLAGEDCGYLRGSTGQWGDSSCANARPFVCERALAFDR